MENRDITRILAAREELLRIAKERQCKKPKFSVGMVPSDGFRLGIIPYSPIVSVIGFESRKEVLEFLEDPAHRQLFKDLYCLSK